MTQIKCAIYTRKSTERGLEQEFNSLHNQEESCRNYILSQSFQGWQYYKTYTDGGISGGTMERPALKQLLSDISKGLVQVVVVYKVDRLSRSITDFHNMMREFERNNCSFVSITQAFDTSTSMSKLTLNMLLSFAQFEREVSAERVRDKIRASKSKGFWTGGIPPLGYDVVNKKLQINDKERQTVCQIFNKYTELLSLNALYQWCVDNAIRNKQWTTAKGKNTGGTLFCKHALNNLLRNPIYIGKIRNKKTGELFDGQHNPIVATEVFERVQESLTAQNNRNTNVCLHKQYMLQGKIFDVNNNVFTNKSTKKSNGRYYCCTGVYLPATDIERITCDTIQELLDSDIKDIISESLDGTKFQSMTYEEKTKQISNLIDHIIYSDDYLIYHIRTDYGAVCTQPNISKSGLGDKICLSEDGKNILIKRRIIINKRMSINRNEACGTNVLTVKENNLRLICALAYGWRYKTMYEQGQSIAQITKHEHKAERTIYKYMALAYLSPKIVMAIMDANAPVIDLQRLFHIAAKYTDFREQEYKFFV